jgi:magnesium chelatase accessory protein
MRWPGDAAGWPMAERSRLVLHRPHRWHVQEAGSGPLILLIHGAGGATQSWRGVFPLLAERARVVAVDLPGQGFSQAGARSRLGLDHMAGDLWSLCRSEGWAPAVIAGHSAGAAVALRMAELGATTRVVGVNAALGNFKGMAGWLFPLLAKALALSPLSAGLFSATVTEQAVRDLIRGTGSEIDAAGMGYYLRLARDRAHVDGTLGMMAQWRLDGLLERLPANTARAVLVVGTGDLAVPPETSRRAAAVMRAARVLELPGCGHLAPEEDPAAVAAAILDALG